MKCLILLLLAGYATASFNEDLESIGFLQYFAIYSLSHSPPKSCPDYSRENLKKQEETAIECVKNIRYNSSFCDTFVHHFVPCIKGLMEEVHKCEGPYDIAIANGLINSVIEEARYVCNNNGEHILEIFNPCVFKSARNSMECRRNVSSPLKNVKDISSVCSTFPSLQKCFEDQMQQECSNEFTRNTLHDLFSVDAKPCNLVMQIFFEIWQHIRY